MKCKYAMAQIIALEIKIFAFKVLIILIMSHFIRKFWILIIRILISEVQMTSGQNK